MGPPRGQLRPTCHQAPDFASPRPGAGVVRGCSCGAAVGVAQVLEGAARRGVEVGGDADAVVGQGRGVKALAEDGERGEGEAGGEVFGGGELAGPDPAGPHPRGAVAGEIDRQEHGRAVERAALGGLGIAATGFELA